jgi:hypothetical protein
MTTKADIEDLVQEITQAIDDLPEEFFVPGDFFPIGENDEYPETECAEWPDV